MGVMDDSLLTTGAAAKLLGVSRQHIVDLCEEGELAHVKVGTHRRVQRSEIDRFLQPPLTLEQEKSLWLHRALLGHLMLDPQRVLETARENIARWTPVHRGDGMAHSYLARWEEIIDSGVDAVARALTAEDEPSCDLRQNSPFAGVLTDEERRQVLRAFRTHHEVGAA